jgi:hypothetical protein
VSLTEIPTGEEVFWFGVNGALSGVTKETQDVHVIAASRVRAWARKENFELWIWNEVIGLQPSKGEASPVKSDLPPTGKTTLWEFDEHHL